MEGGRKQDNSRIKEIKGEKERIVSFVHVNNARLCRECVGAWLGFVRERERERERERVRERERKGGGG